MHHDPHQTELILDAIPSLVFLKDDQNRVLRVNRAVLETFGFRRAEVEGRPSAELFPDNADQYYADDMQVIRTGIPKLGYVEPVEDRWVQTDKIPVPNRDGVIDRVLVVATDITELKHSERRQAATNRLLDQTARIAKLGGWEFQIDPPVLSWSDEVCRIHGVPPGHQPELDEAIAFYTPEFRPHIERAVRLAIEERTPWDLEAKLTAADGSAKWVRATGRPETYEGASVKLWGTLQDITEQVDARRELRRSKFAVDNSTEAIYWVREDGRFFYANTAACAMLGYPKEKLLSLRVSDIDPDYPEDVWAAHWERMKRDRFLRLETRHRTAGGGWRPVEMQIHFYEFEGEEFLVGSARDISAARRRTIELERANKDLEEFAYVASHDLKAPLRAINHLAEWLEDDLADGLTEESAKHLAQLKQRIRRMDTLLDDLLAYSRAGRTRGLVNEVDLRRLVDDITQILHVPNEFVVETDFEIERVTARRTPLEAVLRNLIGNAIKHHDRSGGVIRVESRAAGERVEFSVVDDGPGIEPEFRERAFGMFQTLRPRDRVEGSGMGLALVKKLVEAEGGEVSLGAAEPRGLRVRFTWPIKAEGGQP